MLIQYHLHKEVYLSVTVMLAHYLHKSKKAKGPLLSPEGHHRLIGLCLRPLHWQKYSAIYVEGNVLSKKLCLPKDVNLVIS